jgi:tetrahydromethanopterin S-methyltransferase subunit A
MKETLENLQLSLPLIENSSDLLENIRHWLKQMETTKYSCLGCKYCFPAVAMNIFNQSFPEGRGPQSLSCGFAVREQIWPSVPGEYYAFCNGSDCPVAVSTLASVELAEEIAGKRPEGLCIIGKTETENIGIDKVIKNTVTNPTIRFLLLVGKDPEGHHSGKTLFSLWQNGVDENMKVVGSPGRHPILKNVSLSEVESFRKQVQVINMIGCEDTKIIINKMAELSKKLPSIREHKKRSNPISSIQIGTVQKILATEPGKSKMDKAGYFVVIPSFEKKIIIVEHYAYDNKLLHIVEGKDASAIYSTIIENGWITELSHAAYLGRELAKAEFSLEHRVKYIQDKAPGKIRR